jgi:Bacterial low temperature requirement A protein (LtrA)
LWSIGLTIEFVGHLVTENIKTLMIPVNIEHVTERFGLFTIIVLGEQVVALLFFKDNGTPATYGCVMFGGLIVFALQILYFDIEAGPQKQHALLAVGWRAQLWFYIHPFLQACVVCVAVGTKLLIHDTLVGLPHGAHGSESFERWTCAGGLCGSYVCLSIIGALHTPMENVLISKKIRLGIRLTAAFISLLLPLFDPDSFPPAAMLGCMAFMGFVVAAIELYGGVPPDKEHHQQDGIGISHSTMGLVSPEDTPRSLNHRAQTTLGNIKEQSTSGHASSPNSENEPLFASGNHSD